MKSKICKIFFVFALIAIQATSVLGLKTGKDVFTTEKRIIENDINSMLLGNYLRRLMLRNNELDSGVFFLDNQDIEAMSPNEINFDLQVHEKSTDELKARMFAYQFSKSYDKAKGLKPFGVTLNRIPEDNWKSYKVILVSEKAKNIVVEVCFPADKKENFAIVVESGNSNSCQNKVNIVK